MAADSPLILIVEDEPGVARLQCRRLERAGFTVEVAADVDAAMRILERRAIDLVVMDYRLGATTGLDLNRRMRIAGFDVPSIIVSGAIDDATVIEAMRAGVKDVLVKSFDYLDQLPEAVRAVLSQVVGAVERAPADRRGASIVIVADHDGVAVLEQRQLQGAGYLVEIVVTLDDALRKIRAGGVDLLLIGSRHNGASGLELYERVKAEGFGVPAILVTGFADQAVAIRALRCGIRDLIPRAADYLESLPASVDRVIAQARTERRMIESELRLASIIGTAMDAIVMCDEQRRIALFNRSAEDMFGCRAADALNARLDDFIPDLEAALIGPRPPDPPRGEGMQRRVEVEGVRTSGERMPIEVSISDVIVNGRRLFTVIARDISERRRAEAASREADHRKDVFLGMLAHELRNPLAAIATAGEVLHRTLEPPAAQKLTNVIRRQTNALARMVDDLLDVSRVTLGKIQLAREPLILGEVVARAADSIRESAAKRQLQLTVAIDPEQVWLAGDVTRLEQVLANLLHNAIKFTPAGGSIAVDARRENGDAVIRVRDTGIGIDLALLPKVFDLFVQGDTSLDRAKSGLGIGLALVRQVVRLHGGEVTARSEGSGHGSEFVVRLPASPEEPVVEPEAATARSAAASGLRVLVVDDQRDLADCVVLLIEALGHHAEAAYDGREALAAISASRPDIMLVDIGMPGMTGYDLALAIRRDPDLAGVRLIALTGYGRDEDRARVLEAGFDLHLTKPVGETRLRDVLDSAAAAVPRRS